jgi:single-strand DNA-binding protein
VGGLKAETRQDHIPRRLVLNAINLTGRLTRDPQLRELPDGTPLCEIRLAVEGMGRNRQAGYIDVAAFGRPGEAAFRVLAKGWLVAVHGRLEHREWTPTDGSARETYSVAGQVELLASPRGNGAGPQHPDTQGAIDDDYPGKIPY